MKLDYAWYNHTTEKYEYGPMPDTDSIAENYLPQGPARNLYSLYRETGLSIADAMVKVLEFCVATHPLDKGGGK